jgi:CRP/FNR family cyclic AMP-dependent transcriptional regulator
LPQIPEPQIPRTRVPGRPRILDQSLRDHLLFAGLDSRYLDLLSHYAWSVGFADGSFLFREGQPAEKFFLILDGKVSLETAAPGSGAIVVQTIGGGEVAGFSWLLEPHRWEFDGRAVGTVRAIGLDGARLREECDEDPALGYELMRRFARLATRRMQAARIRLLDVYGRAHA